MELGLLWRVQSVGAWEQREQDYLFGKTSLWYGPILPKQRQQDSKLLSLGGESHVRQLLQQLRQQPACRVEVL